MWEGGRFGPAMEFICTSLLLRLRAVYREQKTREDNEIDPFKLAQTAFMWHITWNLAGFDSTSGVLQ